MKNYWTWWEKFSKFFAFLILSSCYAALGFPRHAIYQTYITICRLLFPLLQSSNYARRKQERPTYGAVCPYTLQMEH